MSKIAFTCNNLTFNGRNFYVKKEEDDYFFSSKSGMKCEVKKINWIRK